MFFEDAKVKTFLTFSSESIPPLGYFSPKDADVQLVLQYSMNKVVKESYRSVYNIFNFIVEIRGLFSFLNLFGGALTLTMAPILNSIHQTQLLFMVS